MAEASAVIRVPLGGVMVAVRPPPGWRVSVATRPSGDSLPPSLPLEFGPSLERLARGARSALIAFTDATRACPDALLIPPILAQLHRAGLPPEEITLLCAVGMHRPTTPAEKVAKLGQEILARYCVVDHDPADAVSLGDYDGLPLTVNPLCLQADLLLSTGIVEPHQYAGWSGGGKTVAMGCAGAETIAATHCPHFLDSEGVRLGRLVGNPFQSLLRESARRAGLKYVVNVGLSESGQIIASASGPPSQVHDELAASLLSLHEVPVPAPFDLVIAGVGPPKDANLYQASRAVTYIGLSHHRLLKPGGVIILPATCPEGAGQGVGERNFLAAMSSAPDVDTLLDRLRREAPLPGQQRAFMLGQVLRQHPVIVAGATDPQVVRACHMTPAADIEEALRLAAQFPAVGDAPGVLVVPHATQTLPVPRHSR